MVGLDQVEGLAYVDVEGNLVVPEARDAFLAVYSIRDVVEHLSDHLEVHLDDRVDRVEALDRVDRADHHGIAFRVVDVGQDLVRVDPAEVDHRVRLDLLAVRVVR